MSRLPADVTRLNNAAGLRYEARVNPPRGGGSCRQLKRSFPAVAAAVEWYT